MSDHSKAAGSSDIFRCSGAMRPQDPNQLQRMGHWNHINSILAQSIPRNPGGNADVHKDECARRGQSLLAQIWKLKRNGQMPQHGSSPVMSDAVEGMIAGKGTMDMTGDCPRKENTRAFETERMILSKTSVCRMESSRVAWKNVGSSAFLHSGVENSQWQRHAEFNANQKTQSLVRSKRKYGCWYAGLDKGQLQTTQSEFSLAPEELKPMPEEFQFQGEYMMHLSRLYRFFEKKRLCCSGPLWNDSTGSASGCGLGGFCQIEDAGPSIFNGDENNHPFSGVAYKEKLASHNCLNLENEISEPCRHSLLSFSEMKRDERLIMGCSWPMPNDQSPKACTTDVSGSKLLLIKGSSMEGFMKLKESLDKQHFRQSIPRFSKHELRRCTTLDSVVRPLGISINDEKDGGQSVDAYSTDVQNESDAGTAWLDIDAHKVESLPKGISPARSDKKDFAGMQIPRKSESTCQEISGIHNPRKSESTSALQMKEATISNQKPALRDKSLDFFPCNDAADTVEPNGLSISRADAMEVGHIISNVGKPDNSASGHQPENLQGTEASSRWVKRLKLNSDSVSIGTRDHNMEDVLTTRRVHKLFSRVMNYSRSNSFTLAKCLQERRQFQKTMLLLRNSDSPAESSKESHPWIQRLCQKGEETARPKTRKTIEVFCEPEMTKSLPEDLEGKLFPSLAAMALMGKSINNFRPCEFRRRGSSLVWNTEGF